MAPSLPDSVRIGGIVILLAALALSLGGVGLLVHSARMTRETISRRINLVRRGAPARPRPKPLTPVLSRPKRGPTEEGERRETERLLSRFGVAAPRAATVLTQVRLGLAAALASAGFLVAWFASSASGSRTLPFLLATVPGILGWLLPMMLIRRHVKAHSKAIQSGLPDALELLVICVQAGLSFEDGVDRVAGVLEKSQPALAEELTLTAADLKILPSREQALANLAGRVDVPSVQSVVTTLSQTLRYGTPLAQALRVVSAELRNDTLMRLEERANQLPTLMTVPMILFIMPTIFLVVAGPAALQVMKVMGH